MHDLAVARDAIERWFRAGLVAVDPAVAVHRALAFDPISGVLSVNGDTVLLTGTLEVVAIGKAAAPMARAACDVCGDRVSGGIVITKDGHLTERLPASLETFEASHPIPDERGVRAASRAIERVSRLGAGDVVIALISGGGSALFEAPVEPLTLQDMAQTTDALLRAGAPIQDLNAVRTPLSRVKGGGFRACAPNATFITLILSDVLSNDASVIASGPTVPRQAHASRSLDILRQHDLMDRVPPIVVDVLTAQSSIPLAEAVTTSDIVEVIADNATAIAGIAEAIRHDGLRPLTIWEKREGEASALGSAWVDACQHAPEQVDVILGGGEATVTVRGDGVGGRNTEFALAAGIALAAQHAEWIVASLATDGQDALTGVAGAIADPSTVVRAEQAGLHPVAALRDNDSLAVFTVAGGIVNTGPTGTNVNDCYIGLRRSALGRLKP